MNVVSPEIFSWESVEVEIPDIAWGHYERSSTHLLGRNSSSFVGWKFGNDDYLFLVLIAVMGALS